MVAMTTYQTVTAADLIERDGAIKLYDRTGFDGMMRAGQLAAHLLDLLVPHVVPGVPTQELDDIVRRETIAAGATTTPSRPRLAIAATPTRPASRSIMSSAMAYRGPRH